MAGLECLSLSNRAWLEMFTLTSSIGAESESLQVVVHREKLPPEATMEVLASEAEAAIKATNYLRRLVPDS
jgi:hypothetical protein